LARAVHDEFTTLLGPGAVTYSILTRYGCQRQFPSILIQPEEPSTTVIDEVSLDALEKQSFSFNKGLDQLTWIPTMTVRQSLTQSFKSLMKHCRWDPHSLTVAQRAERVTLLNELLCLLCSLERHGW
jgi:hypothetical protein